MLLIHMNIIAVFAGEDFINAVSPSQHADDPNKFVDLTTEEYERIIKGGKSIDLDQHAFLRNPDYIISYSEFLFLLSKFFVIVLHKT